MKQLVYLFLLVTSVSALAQAPAKKASEWDVLDQTFIKLVETLTKKQKPAFLQIALTTVDCPDCPEVDGYTKDGAYLPASIFFDQTSGYFSQSAIYKALATRGYTFASGVIKKYKAPDAPASTAKDLKVYDVWVHTYLPGQISKDHKGGSHAFRFIKKDGKFRFFGLVVSE
jgi:hypothetical protein